MKPKRKDRRAPKPAKRARAREWLVEYEIPPLRAIYRAECTAEDEDQVRSIVAKEQPRWNIRKIEVLAKKRKGKKK